MIKMLKNTYLHSLLFSLYPILFLYSVNIDQLDFFAALVPMLLSFCVSAVSVAIIFAISKNREKSTLLTSAYLFLFYSYGAFLKAGNSLMSGNRLSNSWLPALWIGLFILVSLSFFKANEIPESVTPLLNVIALALMLMTLGNITWFHASRQTPLSVKLSTQEASSVSDKPDIYYIILDAYSRNDVLKELYKYNNEDFTAFLNDKGFYVADKSYANYSQTYLSLASSLNLTYLDQLQQKYEKINSVDPLVEMIKNNKVFAGLKAQSYVNLAFSSGYSGTELRSADRFFGRSMLSHEFVNLVINSTFLTAFSFSFFDLEELQIEIHRNRIKETFQAIPQIDHSLEPKFVFAHLLCPHPPFVFKADGSRGKNTGNFTLLDGSHWKGTEKEYRKLYIEQLKYVTKLTKTMITKLLTQNKRKKVIILQSDHGPGSQLNWQSPEQTNMKERMAILTAIYFDDQNYEMLYPEITPVNIFRVIFNKYFSQNYELLKDKSYFSKWWGRYQFIDLTEKLN
jgi:hypothetical protein